MVMIGVRKWMIGVSETPCKASARASWCELVRAGASWYDYK